MGRLILWTSGPVEFGTCICSTCWEQSFSRTCRFFRLCASNIPRYFLDFAPYISGTLNTRRECNGTV